MYYVLFTWLLCSLMHVASATDTQVYKYVDKKGNTVIGNTKAQNATLLPLPALNIYAVPMSAADLHASGYTTKNIAQLDNSQARWHPTPVFGVGETLRQQILNEELTKEQSMLLDSKQLLAQGKTIKYPSEIKDLNRYNTRITLLQDSINEHTKNIELLNRELGE